MGLATEPVKILVAIVLLVTVIAQHASAERHHLHWTVENRNITRNCYTVNVATINGQYPGPTIEIDEGDTLIIQLTSFISDPVTLHWHGIFQTLTNWADGPAHITQCPLQYGMNYTYEFTVDGQSGTFFWHAHINWLRETLYGAIIVHPRKAPYYGKNYKDLGPFLLGEWWSEPPNTVEKGFIDTTAPGFTATICGTINGQPGPLNNCSKEEDTPLYKIKTGETYLLRLVNAALDNDWYFKIANHSMTVVAADGNYLKPFVTTYVSIAPGQTTNVLFTANQTSGRYYFGTGGARAITDNTANFTVGIFQYEHYNKHETPMMPPFPTVFKTINIDRYQDRLRGYEPYSIPLKMDHSLIWAADLTTVPCHSDENCTTKIAGTVQNATWDDPKNTSILEAYFYDIKDKYTTGIPNIPPTLDDFISVSDIHYNQSALRATRVKKLKFNDTVQLVLQNVKAFGILAHPFHLHGQDFYVIGSNYSNYDPSHSPKYFNLVDPPKFNTYAIPDGGYIVIRFQANNPGVWLFHCHYETHKSWGMQTVFITENGKGASQTLPGPKHPRVKCTS